MPCSAHYAEHIPILAWVREWLRQEKSSLIAISPSRTQQRIDDTCCLAVFDLKMREEHERLPVFLPQLRLSTKNSEAVEFSGSLAHDDCPHGA